MCYSGWKKGKESYRSLFARYDCHPQEIEKLRELNLQAEGEKVNAVANVRNEAKAEIEKMRDKIQEVRIETRIGSQN